MYKIIGADQKEYGPVSADQIRQWIAEGRANGQTLVRLEDGPWKPLSTFSEFSALLSSPSTPPPLGAPPLTGGYTANVGGPKTSGIIITGFVLSVLGILCCGPLFSVPALVMCIIGYSQANRNPELYGGKGLAIAGIALSLISLIMLVIIVMTGTFTEIMNEVIKNFPNLQR